MTAGMLTKTIGFTYHVDDKDNEHHKKLTTYDESFHVIPTVREFGCTSCLGMTCFVTGLINWL